MINLFSPKKNTNFSFASFTRSSGITLLELIVSMAIIAILTVSLWGNFSTSLAKGRDSKRKQDLASIAKALELYYNDNKAYPSPLPNWGSILSHPTRPHVIYMQKLPADPSSPYVDYCYRTDVNAAYYQLYARLENSHDPERLASYVSCGMRSDYNYGISSGNILP